MRIVFISCETPQITTILDLLSRHLSENVALARLDVGAGSDIRAVAQEVSDLASSNSNVFVTVTDASLSSLVARVFAKHIGHIHWHLDYFVPIENSCSEITNLPSISGVTSTSVLGELANSATSLFLSERNAVAARQDSGQGQERIGILPLPLEIEPGGNKTRVKIEVPAQLRIALACPPVLEYRAVQVLRGAVASNKQVSCIWMCEESEQAAVLEIVESFPEIAIDIVIGRSPKTWAEILQRSDCACHLSESPYELFYYYLMLSLASGVEVVCSDLYAAGEIPQEACWKISPGCDEVSELASAFTTIHDSLISQVHGRGVVGVEYASLLGDPSLVSAELVNVSSRVSKQLDRTPVKAASAIGAILGDLESLMHLSAIDVCR